MTEIPTKDSFTIKYPSEMDNRENKISNGLARMLNRNQNSQFPSNQDVFVGNPGLRSSYFESFYQAQLAEIASESKSFMESAVSI